MTTDFFIFFSLHLLRLEKDSLYIDRPNQREHTWTYEFVYLRLFSQALGQGCPTFEIQRATVNWPCSIEGRTYTETNKKEHNQSSMH
jgi:hypothetical protein